MTNTVNRDVFINAAREMFGEISVITRKDISEVCDRYNLTFPTWLTNVPALRVSRGTYTLEKIVPNKKINLPRPVLPQENMEVVHAVAAVQLNVPAPIDYTPAKVGGYVPFGNFSDVRAIIKSNKFYPVYITGLSGNGKTMMVDQVCAAEKRELIRVNITIETDEDDLIGGFRLVDGRTVWQNGPVVTAMERGAILLLDEVDLGSNKLMCLQPVLEGKAIFLKKISKIITPVAGFSVIATANTKGKGSDDGRFIGANVMNEAFLERFSITLEQEYPNNKTEEKILNNVLNASGLDDKDFVSKLVAWADITRKSFADGAISEIISTRRLVHICEAFDIFDRNRKKAIELCINRFDFDTKSAFMDLYMKLDETLNPIVTEPVVEVLSTEEVAF
jgi:midasin (ATPase involved in ribosome maturation)